MKLKILSILAIALVVICACIYIVSESRGLEAEGKENPWLGKENAEIRLYIISKDTIYAVPPTYPAIKESSDYVVIIRRMGIDDDAIRLMQLIGEGKKKKTIADEAIYPKYTGEIYIDGKMLDWFTIGGRNAMIINRKIVEADHEVERIISRYAVDL